MYEAYHRLGGNGTLHSTMFLLIHLRTQFHIQTQPSLHSTMFLLILAFVQKQLSAASFTFHNVSINTQQHEWTVRKKRVFTFHNVSINTSVSGSPAASDSSLHSTMFLLIPSAVIARASVCASLHSTMFLLIQSSGTGENPYLFSLHSTMFLLIPRDHSNRGKSEISFTFHNVSINTDWADQHFITKNYFTFHNVSINTPFHKRLYKRISSLYIPQCFY